MLNLAELVSFQGAPAQEQVWPLHILHCKAGMMCRLCALCYVRLVCVLCWIKCVLTDLDTDQLYCCCSCIGLVRLGLVRLSWSLGHACIYVAYVCIHVFYYTLFRHVHLRARVVRGISATRTFPSPACRWKQPPPPGHVPIPPSRCRVLKCHTTQDRAAVPVTLRGRQNTS